MVLHSADRSSSQPQVQENSMVLGSVCPPAGEADRQAAARQMRYQLHLLDRSQRRLSIEETMASMLEEPAAGLSA